MPRVRRTPIIMTREEIIEKYLPKDFKPVPFDEAAFWESQERFFESLGDLSKLPKGPIPPPPPKPEPIYSESWDQLSLSDDDLVNLVKTRPAWEENMFRGVHLICPDAAVKSGPVKEAEYFASELARTSTTIPIPRIHRFFRAESGGSYMVMQWIQGRPLDKCWSELSIWRKIVIIWTLRGYVKQLRKIPNPVPGKLGPLNSAYRLESAEKREELWYGINFGEFGDGPFDSYQEMVDWQNETLDISKHYERAPKSTPRFDDSYPLVFTHYDIQRKNLVLDENNKLWMIDFGQSGFYPEPFEYAALYENWWVRMRWRWLSFLQRTVVANVVAGFYWPYHRRMFSNVSWEWTVDRGRLWWEVREQEST